MKASDPRHQQYLEPLIRFAATDLRLVLNDEVPEKYKRHRLAVCLNMLEASIKQMDAVIAKELGDNQEALTQAVARIDAASQMHNITLTERIVNYVERVDATAALLPPPSFLSQARPEDLRQLDIEAGITPVS